MTKGPEGKLQKKMQEALNKEFPESFFYKTHGGPMQKRGIPDLIGCVNGRFIGIEVKVPGKERTLTELQKDTLEQINKAGGLGFMATSVEQAISTIRINFHIS